MGSEPKQPKTIIYHPSDFIQYIQQTLGVINFQEDFGHFFLNARLFMDLVSKTNEALRIGVIKKKNGKRSLNEEALRRLRQIWYGHIYILVSRDRDYNIIESKAKFPKKAIREPENDNEELIKCPALENMNPVSPIGDKQLHIKIREFVPIKYAWWGYDSASLVTSGKMNWSFQDGQKPYFESDEDIIFSQSLTDDVGREYFHNMINLLTNQFSKYQDHIFMELHTIVEENRSFSNNDKDDDDFNNLIMETE